jgi:LPXTG-motif cell wall-anchored protein
LKSTVSRALTRVGVAAAAGLIAATTFAQPAFAADGADLSVRFTGTTIAAFSDGKFGKLTIRNDGPGTATGVVVKFDVSALDDSKIDFLLSSLCDVAGDIVTCTPTADSVPPPGGESDFDVPLARQAGASGAAGTLTATVESADDPNAGNNSQTVNVNVGNSGVDLVVFAPDVYALAGPLEYTSDPVPLGGTSRVFGSIFNFGDLAADGVKIVVTLPEHVTFAETEPDCTYSADNRVATCLYTDVTLFPTPPEPPDSDDDFLFVWWPVNVSADAPGPAALPGGLMTAEAIDILQPEGPAVRSTLRGNKRWMSLDEIPDVDPGDNEDPFAVFVAGDLPVTGARTGLYALAGAGLLLLGALIVVLARLRRRAVTPA